MSTRCSGRRPRTIRIAAGEGLLRWNDGRACVRQTVSDKRPRGLGM